MLNIHTVGDSHSYYGWGSSIVKHHLGPVLCYRVGKDKLDRCDIQNFNIQDGDTIVFCFGEIDCRCHIHKHITDTVTYTYIIDNIIDAYFKAIDLNVAAVAATGVKLKNVCVYNVVPPIQKYNTCENAEYPFLGTDDERKQYVLYFNEKLKSYCMDKEYIYFDVYDKYVDANGFLRKDLSDGHVHINNGVFIQEFIDRHLKN